MFVLRYFQGLQFLESRMQLPSHLLHSGPMTMKHQYESSTRIFCLLDSFASFFSVTAICSTINRKTTAVIDWFTVTSPISSLETICNSVKRECNSFFSLPHFKLILWVYLITYIVAKENEAFALMNWFNHPNNKKFRKI